MRRRRVAVVTVSAEQLAEKLGVWDARVTHVERDGARADTFNIMIEGPTLPLADVGMTLEAFPLERLQQEDR